MKYQPRKARWGDQKKSFAPQRMLNGAVIVLTLCLFAVCLAYQQQSREVAVLRERVAFQEKANDEATRRLGLWEAKRPQ